jgi:hypothetical protein
MTPAADALEGDTPPSTIEGDAAAVEVAAAAAASTPPVETPPVETPPVETPPVDTPPVEGTPPVETPPVDDWKAKYEALMADRAQAPAAPAPAAPEPDTTPTPAEIYSADEKTFLESYAKEWPDVARGEALARRREYQQLIHHVFSEVARTYGPLIERGALAADQVAEDATLNVVRGVHTDYNAKMYDDVIVWVDGLSGTRKKIAQAIIEEGEPEEVIDLVTEYKSANGLNKPKAVAGAPAAPAAAPVTALSAQAKQAAKAMGVVDSKRSVTGTAVPNVDDFDAAWAEANAAGSK